MPDLSPTFSTDATSPHTIECPECGAHVLPDGKPEVYVSDERCDGGRDAHRPEQP